jgi:hypothetical protein
MHMAGVQMRGRDTAPWLLPIVGLLAAGALYLPLAGLPSIDLDGPLHKAVIRDPFCGGRRATSVLLTGVEMDQQLQAGRLMHAVPG